MNVIFHSPFALQLQ